MLLQWDSWASLKLFLCSGSQDMALALALLGCWLSKFSSCFIVLQGLFAGDHLNNHHLGKTQI